MKDDIYDVLAKALSGETKLNKLVLKEWLNEKSSNITIFNSLKFHWRQPNQVQKISGEKVYERINRRIQTSDRKQITRNYRKQYWRYFERLAAILIIALGLAWSIYQLDSSNRPAKPTTIVEKTNPSGQKSTFTLSDGTIVKLNSNSKIKFPSIFDVDKREVFLDGEAFFEVVKNTEKPFVVHTGDLQTIVLGTSFNVNAYPDQSEIKVALVSGRVLVKRGSDTKSADIYEPVILEPNQLAIYDHELNTIKKSHFKLEEITAWKDGVLVLKNADLERIKKSLEDWYGVKITYLNSRQQGEDISANYYNEPLENVLKSLGYSLNFDFTIDEKNVQIIFIDN